MKSYLLTITFLWSIAFHLSASPEKLREKICFDYDWKFHLTMEKGAEQQAGPRLQTAINGWEDVQLPHDWSIHMIPDSRLTGCNGHLRGGKGEYRKTFHLPKSDKGRCISIVFDGIYNRSNVYVNGQHLGFRPYGFCQIIYDMTPYVKYGEDNEIYVTVDNPSDNDHIARWYTGSGIYRHAWLVKTNSTHISHNGTYITTIANKQQQLEELKRQLALEESRKKKNQDEDKMLELRSNIKDLQYEINNMTEEVVNNLTGSDVKSAAEEFVDTWVEAWKAGETTLDAIGEKMDEVIQNIVKKAMTQKIVGALLQPLYNELDRMTSVGSEGGEELTIEELRQLAARAGIVSNDINTALGAFYGNLEQLGLVAKTQEQEQQLSALQQGIQGVTEQTANALEGYMNGLSQQAYLRNDLLMQIRDALTLTDNDMAMGVQAQILLQLQQSYVLIQSIHSLMGNWTIPDGSGIRVQLL